MLNPSETWNLGSKFRLCYSPVWTKKHHTVDKFDNSFVCLHFHLMLSVTSSRGVREMKGAKKKKNSNWAKEKEENWIPIMVKNMKKKKPKQRLDSQLKAPSWLIAWFLGEPQAPTAALHQLLSCSRPWLQVLSPGFTCSRWWEEGRVQPGDQERKTRHHPPPRPGGCDKAWSRTLLPVFPFQASTVRAPSDSQFISLSRWPDAHPLWSGLWFFLEFVGPLCLPHRTCNEQTIWTKSPLRVCWRRYSWTNPN